MSADSLTPAQRALYAPCFESTTLDHARVRVTDRFPGAVLDVILPRISRGARLDFADSRGLTLNRLILLRPDVDLTTDAGVSLLFHELVHVQQFASLTPRGFVHEYARSWFAERSYRAISLEEQAYELQDRWERNERPDVAAAIADRFA